MRVGEVAVRAGVNVETLRYYERRGLLPEPARSVGGHREYGADTVRFVRAVKEAQSLGFSLAEIEEYLSLTRRDPNAAPAAARERLDGKLEAVDAKMAALRTMRAGLVRARYELWDSVAHSTSNAAYLARGGRDPDLEGVPLHVTNGESVASTLRTTSLEGVVLSWDDVLHVGPLAVDPAESRPLRARFLAEHGWGDEAAILAELERRDALLARARVLVLWFEHDLFDQLQLLQVLAQLDDEAEVELVQADDFLGSYDADRLEALWDARRPVDGARARARARRVARGVRERPRQSSRARPGRVPAPRGGAPSPSGGASAAAADEAAAPGGARRRAEDAARALPGQPDARGGDLPRRHVVLPLRLGARARRARPSRRTRAAPAAAAARRARRVRRDDGRADAFGARASLTQWRSATS
jgi:DNA-binding transcriptional MerR regulator